MRLHRIVGNSRADVTGKRTILNPGCGAGGCASGGRAKLSVSLDLGIHTWLSHRIGVLFWLRHHGVATTSPVVVMHERYGTWPHPICHQPHRPTG